MTRRLHTPFALLCASLAAAGLVAACGGGSSSSGPAAVTTTTVSGSVVKGPVNGANVCAYKATAAGKGDLLACVTTNSAGGYTMEAQRHTKPGGHGGFEWQPPGCKIVVVGQVVRGAIDETIDFIDNQSAPAMFTVGDHDAGIE